MMSNRGNSESDCIASIISEDRDNDSDGEVGNLMWNLFERQLYTDVKFYSNVDKSTIQAHRAVLAVQSSFFANLLFGDHTNNAVGMMMKVEISHVPFSIFTAILKYLYTGDAELDDDRVMEICAAAESFEIQKLVDQCKIYIESIELNEDNVCSTLQMCNSKHIEGLKNRCISYIKENTFEVIGSPDFEKCSFSTVREICDLQSLNLFSEKELFEAVLRWLNVQPKHTKKELMKAFLKCIRFLSFTAKEFSDFMQKHSEIMPAEEGLKILMYLNNPTTEGLQTLPKWCCKHRRVFKYHQKDYQEKVKNKDCYDGHKINIGLKSTDEEQNFNNLTCTLQMKCNKGNNLINYITFSFEDTASGGNWLASLVINVRLLPSNVTFRRNFAVALKESTFIFPKPMNLRAGQEIVIEVAAKRSHSCRFLQYKRWHNEVKEFEIHLFSKPEEGGFNFISGIGYTSK